jgi:hypothetical protein
LTQKIIEGRNTNVRNCVVSDQRKEKEIEKHVEPIQPEILSYWRLVFSPGKGNFQHPNY